MLSPFLPLDIWLTPWQFLFQIAAQLSVERMQTTAESPYTDLPTLDQGLCCLILDPLFPQSYSTLSHPQTMPALAAA